MKYPKATVLCSVALSSAIIWACGSPEITFSAAPDAAEEPRPTPPSPDAPVEVPDAADSGTPVVDAAIDEDAPFDLDALAPPDVVERVDASKVPDGGTCPGLNPCDCDNDGYTAKGTCGGNDCDDRDPLRHPNQGFVDEPLDPGKTGDWDCSGGSPVKQYNLPLNCAALLGLNCNTSAQGFLVDVPCGVESDYFVCQAGLLSCTAVKVGTRRQGCM